MSAFERDLLPPWAQHAAEDYPPYTAMWAALSSIHTARESVVDAYDGGAFGWSQELADWLYDTDRLIAMLDARMANAAGSILHPFMGPWNDWTRA
ncbi:hypothetical protein LTR12_008709 [Friedmanniomyces endolithicus]|nr:hypothetical protein LTR12_008709 [Friedmanniomyces endolithicus]